MMEVSYLSVKRMIIPDGWVEEPFRKEHFDLRSLKTFHPPDPSALGYPSSQYDSARISLSLLSWGPPGSSGDEQTVKLFAQPPHQLTVQEASSRDYINSRSYPPDMHWREMRTEFWNYRLVLIAEGEQTGSVWQGLHEFLMLVDGRLDTTISIIPLEEISYTAPAPSYYDFLPQVKRALQTIEWTEQRASSSRATTRRPFSFLLRLLGKGR